MKNLKVIAFTHKHVDLKDLGNLVICNEELESRLINLKHSFDIPEIFYVGTCNRVEFVFYGAHELKPEFIKEFMHKLNFCVPSERLECFLGQVTTYEGMDALNHLLRMSCSLESLVVGEKEILAQVRKAYERCRVSGFTGDFLRLVMDRLVKTAKEVYTHTHISVIRFLLFHWPTENCGKLNCMKTPVFSSSEPEKPTRTLLSICRNTVFPILPYSIGHWKTPGL